VLKKEVAGLSFLKKRKAVTLNAVLCPKDGSTAVEAREKKRVKRKHTLER